MSLFSSLSSNFDFFSYSNRTVFEGENIKVPGGGGGGRQTLMKIAKILHVRIFSQGAYICEKLASMQRQKKGFF